MAKVRKAIVAGIGAAIAGLTAALAGGAELNAASVGAALGVGAAAAWATWRIPNSDGTPATKFTSTR